VSNNPSPTTPTTPPTSKAHIGRSLTVAAWVSFVCQVAIIATGGAVRLTESGLGCPTWPTCTATSLIPTTELSYHSIIEFGNRMMTGLLGVVALVIVILVWMRHRTRRDLFALALTVLGGIAVQALIGGVTVITGLNPFIVGLHYLISVLLVCVAAVFLARLRDLPGPRTLAVPPWFARLTHLASCVLFVTLVFGMLTTGAGPHSGDPNVARNGFDATLLQHIHSWPGYILAGLAITLMAYSVIRKLPVARWYLVLVLVVVVQVFVGIYQSRAGLPPLAVGVHLVLAALAAASTTMIILRLKRPTG